MHTQTRPQLFSLKKAYIVLTAVLALHNQVYSVQGYAGAPLDDTFLNSQREESIELRKIHPTIHADELYFPKDFLFGFATSHYQIDGRDLCPDSQWAHFEAASTEEIPLIALNQRSGTACDHMHRYKEDIALMKNDFDVNAYRFSVAWDRIEPREGEFNEAALQYHVDEVDELIKNGIEPMATLHHFVHPQWFEEKGGFLVEENIQYFVRFSQKVFEKLGSKVKLWATLNEPNVFAFCGYLPLHCVFPPKTNSPFSWSRGWQEGAKVLKHLMMAHVQTYNALKAMPDGDKAEIGLVHQYLVVSSTGLNPLTKGFGFCLNDFMYETLNFLRTGTFSFARVGICDEEYTAEGKFCDFVGLNYYSHVMVRQMSIWNPFSIDADCMEGEVMTDMQYAIHPQGIYAAIKDVAAIGLPIYITENGIPDKDNTHDWRREKWIREYLKMVSLAIEDGYDVRGFFYWTPFDNFEWDNGYTKNFGLYSVDFDSPEKTRTLKDGGRLYAKIVKAARAGQLSTPTQDRLEVLPAAAEAA